MKWRLVFCAVVLVFGIFPIGLVSPSFASPLDNWHVRAPALTNASFYSVAYGNGLFVAVGQDGTIISSPDGGNWTAQSSGTSSDLYGITYGNGRFVAVGTSWDHFTGVLNSGVALTSVDGFKWEIQSLGLNNLPSSVAFGNGHFVAVGSRSIASSDDGIHWRITTWPQDLYAVVFSNGQFFGLSSWGGNEIYSSSDGVTWLYRMPGAYSECSRLTSLAYGNHTLVAVGGACGVCMIGLPCRMVASSTDFLSWTATEGTFGSNLRAVIFGAGNFVAVGWHSIEVSVNGDSWKKIPVSNEYALNAVEYGGSTFVAVGENGTILQSDPVPYINETIGVPTLSEWGMILFMVLAGLVASLNLRNQTRVS